MSDRYCARAPIQACFIVKIVLFSLIIVSSHAFFIGTLALVYGYTFLITAPLTAVFVKKILGSSRLDTLLGGINMAHRIEKAQSVHAPVEPFLM